MIASSRARRRGALTIPAGGWALCLLLAAPRAVAAQPAPRPLSLAEALRLAAGSSEQVALARAGEQRARGQQAQARSALLPQVATTLNWQRQLQNQFAAAAGRGGNAGGGAGGGAGADSVADNPITRIFASPYNLNIGVTATQPLYTGGRAVAGVRSARAARDAALIGITSAEAQLQLDVTSAYYDALLAERLATIADSAFVQAERTLRQVQLTRNVGSASEFDLIRARVTRDNQRPSLLQARTQRDLALVRLRQLLDLPASEPVMLTDSIADASTDAPRSDSGPITTVNVDATQVLAADPRVTGDVARLVASTDTSAPARAAVRQAQKNVEIARETLKATKGSRLPQLSAQTVYQRLAPTSTFLPTNLNDFLPNWTVGIGLSMPLFSGGNLRGQIMAAEAGVVEARQRLKLAEEGATLDARQATLQLTEAEASWQASIGTAEQAKRAYEIAEVRFREGISTQLELSETRVQLQQALANRARAARDLQVARKRLELLPYLPLSQSAPQAASTNPGTSR